MIQAKEIKPSHVLKQINAFIHHVRSAAVFEALNNAGYTNIALMDVKGTLKAINELEKKYSRDAGVVISEVRVSLVCEETQVEEVTNIIRKVGRIGSHISGWVYVIPVEMALPIGGENG